MKHLITVLTLIIFAVSLNAQTYTVNDFNTPQDTTFWKYFTSDNADTNIAKCDFTYISSPTHEGSMAMQVDYEVHNIESWGGFVKIETWNPDSSEYFDFSAFDTLSIWYNNIVPQDSVGRVEFRLNFYDASDSPDSSATFNADNCEFYYSFHRILDTAPGWNNIKFPMVSNGSWDGTGFNLTGWNGPLGNEQLDLDKIKGYSFEFSIGGGGEGDASMGSIVFDQFELTGLAENPFLLFNGKTVDVNLEQFQWGNSSLALVEGGGEDPATNALLWTQGDAWNGVGWNIAPPVDRGFRWALDSLKFKMKAESGVGNTRAQFESGPNGKVGINFMPIADDQWHEYSLALSDFAVVDGGVDFDSTNLTVFQFLSEGTGASGKKVYLDYLWTGSPVIDVIAPVAPDGITASPSTYVNVITWLDVPNEEGASYNVYYSTETITDINAQGVEVAATNIGGGTQAAEHVILAPVNDQPVTYYYAVVCTDNFGNVGEIGMAASPLTNTAKGVTVINPTAPTGFVADGNFNEWTGITPFRMFPSDGSGSIVTNTTIDGDADLSVNAYVAMDDQYIYVGFDVEDDVVSVDSTRESWLMDATDLFIGLYDWHGPSHTAYQGGDEPDYHFRFNAHNVIIDNLGSAVVMYLANADYYWGEKFPSGYAIEAKIPFSRIAEMGEDTEFAPEIGMRIPIDFAANDNDEPGTNTRQGILTYSSINEDQSYQDVSRWTYTWIGDQWVTAIGDDEDGNIPLVYSLDQNYPNPFNPATTIKFTLKEASNVQLEVFNILGEKVFTIFNEMKNAGSHVVSFDASKLSSGVYIYRLNAGSFVSTKKMMLLK